MNTAYQFVLAMMSAVSTVWPAPQQGLGTDASKCVEQQSWSTAWTLYMIRHMMLGSVAGAKFQSIKCIVCSWTRQRNQQTMSKRVSGPPGSRVTCSS